MYVTTDGLIDFYNVTSRDTVDYTRQVTVTNEETAGYSSKCTVAAYVRAANPYKDTGAYKLPTGTTSGALAHDGTADTLAVVISNIPTALWADISQFGFNYWGDTRTSHAQGMYYYTIDKDTHKIYVQNSDEEAVEDYYCGVWGKNGSTYFIVLGGGTWFSTQASAADAASTQYAVGTALSSNATLAALGLAATTSTNASGNSDAPMLTLYGLLTNIEEAASLGTGDGYDAALVDWATDIIPYFEGTSTVAPTCEDWVYDGVVYSLGDTAESPLGNYTWLVDISTKTLGYIMQSSPTEKTTTVKLTGIGYDKYKYSYAVPLVIGDLTALSVDAIAKLSFNNESNLFFVGAAETEVASLSPATYKLYQYDASIATTDASTANDVCTLAGDSFPETSFLIQSLVSYDTDKEAWTALANKSGIKYNIMYVTGASAAYVETEGDADHPLVEDINYNTMTLSVTEQVYPGEDTSGGTFTGSFDEQGVDSYGSNIYWPNVLNEEDFSFIVVKPVGTMDSFINSHGIYEGTRIVDDVMAESDLAGNAVSSTSTISLKGQRYVTSIVNKNIAAGTVGCAWRDEFTAIMKAGTNEAFGDNYDDVYIFMDPCGQEFVHTLQASLVVTHPLAIAISPKLVTSAEFNTPSKFTVTGRSKQCAQYAGEFKYYDSYTGKSFWMMPIGDVGMMCARIFEKKMGGWPPAWMNYNDMGGQLTRSVLKARWAWSDSATKTLDEKGINPIIYNADDGLMITSSKTTKDPSSETDWSELGHVMAFVLLKREIRDNVMRPQIKKPIDDYWMGVRQTQVDAILAKRTEGSNKIWTAATCDIAGVNTNLTKAARNFCIYVKVKVTKYSDYVTLTLENVSATTVL